MSPKRRATHVCLMVEQLYVRRLELKGRESLVQPIQGGTSPISLSEEFASDSFWCCSESDKKW